MTDELEDELEDDEEAEQQRALDYIKENYESTRLLRAVEYLDKIRGILEPDVPHHPPEIREDLLKLHGLVMEMTGYGRGDVKDLQEVEDLAFMIDDQLEDLIEMAGRIQKILQPLIVTPDEDEKLHDEDDNEW